MAEQLHHGSQEPDSSVALHHRAFPELAASLRDTTDTIIDRLRDTLVKELPHFDRLSIAQFEDDLRMILESAAHALGSDEESDIRALLHSAPRHGFDRFQLNADLLDLLKEERLLRSVIVHALDEHLGRKLEAVEAASLHATIDVMVQQAVLAMVQKQKEKLRASADAEAKFLSFLSHDISNNLMMIFSTLNTLSRQLKASQQFEEAREVLDSALRAIRHTTDGMRRLLAHERLRLAEPKTVITTVNLDEKFSKIERYFRDEAKAKGIRLTVDVDPDATLETDVDLLYIILQNIVGNAIKHSGDDSGGKSGGNDVRLEAHREQAEGRERWRISIADQGPGIERDKLDHIFEAFKQGDALGTEGVGLGLAIAAQAAKLLSARIDVDTQLGRGTTFHINLPATPTPDDALTTRPAPPPPPESRRRAWQKE